METNYKSFEDWELQKKLGSGGYGEVLLWLHRPTKLQIATKSLKKNYAFGSDEEHKLKERWRHELELSKKINTDFIVRGIDIKDQSFIKYLNDNHEWSPLPVLIMEYCNSGDLRAHLQRVENVNGLTEFEIRKVLQTLSGAIDYMHNHCYIKHRDLKPDNIVIHTAPNGERIYKLTDFGFARHIVNKTIMQSVVGTRNYFAPEIVDTAEYTQTVDYWSMGIIAFEMLCGCLPFIPHQSLYNIIRSIKKKPENCVAITEDWNGMDTFKFHDKIFDENRVTTVFREKIENWLRLALEQNFRKRGTSLVETIELPNPPGRRVLTFYTALNEVLDTIVLTTFNLTSNSFHDFELKSDMKTAVLEEEIEKATNIPISRLYCIRPVGHPINDSSSIKNAMDYYVQEWTDTTNKLNPPVMIYLVDMELKSIPTKIPDPKISPLIKHCLRIAENVKIPLWLFQKYAFDIHYLLANEQHRLSTMLSGLHEYAMEVEHEIMNYMVDIDGVNQAANIINGRALQYESMITNAIKRLEQEGVSLNMFGKWTNSIAKFQEKIIKSGKIIKSLIVRSKSALRRMKQESESPFYDEVSKKDVYQLEYFRRHLQAEHRGFNFEVHLKQVLSCKHCSKTVYEFTEKRAEVIGNNQKKLKTISEIHEEFRLIKDISDNTKKILDEMKEDIEVQTSAFYNEFFDAFTMNVNRSTNLAIDGVGNAYLGPLSNESSINRMCFSITDAQGKSTKDLINEATELIQLMSIDYDSNQSIPKTVNFDGM